MTIAGIDFQVLWAIFVFLVVFNFLPVCIAFVSGHPQRVMIGLLNVISLFSFALWIALMVWAVGGKRNDSVIGRFVGNPLYNNILKLGVASIAAFSVGASIGELGIV